MYKPPSTLIMSQNTYEDGVSKPNVTQIIEQEHIMLCSVINNLQTQLEAAKTRREEIRHILQDRNYVDHNVASAAQWITYEHIDGHSWQTHSSIQATLKKLLGDMNMCECCPRHIIDRPTCDDIYREIHYPRKLSLSLRQPERNFQICDCKCRYMARRIHRRLLKQSSV